MAFSTAKYSGAGFVSIVGWIARKILLVYTKKSFMEESGNEPENASVICALLPLSACVTLAPRQAATVTMMNNGVCIRVPAQSGERLDWLEIMRSDQPSSAILHYDVTHPVWVFPMQCLPTSDFRFVAGKSYAVLVTTVVNEKEARQYEARFETGKGAR